MGGGGEMLYLFMNGASPLEQKDFWISMHLKTPEHCQVYCVIEIKCHNKIDQNDKMAQSIQNYHVLIIAPHPINGPWLFAPQFITVSPV